jgi:hypothetical protein
MFVFLKTADEDLKPQVGVAMNGMTFMQIFTKFLQLIATYVPRPFTYNFLKGFW